MIKETNGAAGRLGGGLAFWRGKPVMATNMTHLAPLNLAGLLFGDPCPLRWLPADARRMPRADSAEAAGEFFWRAAGRKTRWGESLGQPGAEQPTGWRS